MYDLNLKIIIIIIIILLAVISTARYLIGKVEHTALYRISQTYKIHIYVKNNV